MWNLRATKHEEAMEVDHGHEYEELTEVNDEGFSSFLFKLKCIFLPSYFYKEKLQRVNYGVG